MLEKIAVLEEGLKRASKCCQEVALETPPDCSIHEGYKLEAITRQCVLEEV